MDNEELIKEATKTYKTYTDEHRDVIKREMELKIIRNHYAEFIKNLEEELDKS